MPMTRDQARTHVRTFAQVDATPSLTAGELEQVLTLCRMVDQDGHTITDPLYVETIWATRAVVYALDLRVAKAAQRVDVSADGTRVDMSQRHANLVALRRSWRARMVRGSV